MSRQPATSSRGPDPIGRALDALQALGATPVVNPRRGRLPGVEPTPDRVRSALAWGVFALVVLLAATVVTVVFGDHLGGFIYANF